MSHCGVSLCDDADSEGGVHQSILYVRPSSYSSIYPPIHSPTRIHTPAHLHRHLNISLFMNMRGAVHGKFPGSALGDGKAGRLTDGRW